MYALIVPEFNAKAIPSSKASTAKSIKLLDTSKIILAVSIVNWARTIDFFRPILSVNTPNGNSQIMQVTDSIACNTKNCDKLIPLFVLTNNATGA